MSKRKYTISFVMEEFEKEGYELLSNGYVDAHQKLKYICPEEHIHNISWTKWQQGQRCFYCVGNVKPTLDFIKKDFEKESYTLLTDKYKNAKQKLKYICPIGHKSYTTWSSWKKGHRCFKCKYINMSGKNHPNWKGGISCEPYCYEWSFKEFKNYIKERDGNKCLNPDCWGNIHRLSVHHIDYNKKNCGPVNLITLCASCNSRANKDREWHEAWYSVILQRRYNYQETTNAQ